MQKKSFILYCDYLDHIDLLSNEEAGKLFKAVLQYASCGDSKESLDSAAMMAFSFIKSQMERDNADYTAKCEKLRANGAKGGRPKQMVIEEPKGNQEKQMVIEEPKGNQEKQMVIEEPKGNQEKQMVIEEPKAPLNDNDTVNVTDTVNDTDTEINKTLMIVCDLLNQAKAKARSKGRLKAASGEWEITDLLNDGFSHEYILAIAGEIAEAGKSVDWFEFDKLVRNKKKAASR